MSNAPPCKKQELLRTVFDNSLYYEDRIYRTPYLISELAHNELKMKEKGLLIINKKGKNREILPLSGGEGIRTPVLRDLSCSSPSAACFAFLSPGDHAGKTPTGSVTV